MKGKTLALVSALAHVAPSFALWPLPRQFSSGNSTLRLSNSFAFDASAIQGCPEDLEDAISRAQGYLTSDQLAPLTPDRGASIDASSAPELGYLVLSLSDGASVSTISSEATKLLEERSESYSLTVPGDGSNATLSANSTLGLFRGLTTFGQLWYSSNSQIYATQAPLQVDDVPAYPYRGFMLDTARNYFPVSDIKRTLDAMSWVKLNEFHWHIVDSQSFPLQIPGFEELSASGAYDNSSVYSPSDVADVISYASARGIDVMLEIDTPGHTSAIGNSHPELMACKDATPWGTYAAEPPAGQLRITDDSVVNFTTTLFGAVTDMVQSPYISTGGDEVNAQCYTDDQQTQQALNSSGQTIEQALSSFVGATHEKLASAGKTPVVWEELVLEHNVTLANNTLVIVWISSADAVNVTSAGFPVIQAPSDYFYLDCGAGAWVGNYASGTSWCDPFKSWQYAYSYDPLANITDAKSQALVKGGQSLLWTEQSGPQNLDPIVWPRAAAAAEVFWLGGTLPDSVGGGNRSTDGVDSALPRMHDLSFRMRQRGVNTINLQPLYCALRPGVCDLTA